MDIGFYRVDDLPQRIQQSRNFGQEKESAKIYFLGPETDGWGGGSSTRRDGGRKVDSLPRRFVCPGMSQEVLGVSRTFGSVQNVSAKRIVFIFSALQIVF